jgi:hypothetical protein
MKKNSNIYYLLILLFIILILFVIFITYAYHSGSCQIKKKYKCNNNFCLVKEFNVYLPYKIKKNINHLIHLPDIQKRVNITTYPETIFNCALPNKKGITITTENIHKYAPEIIYYYQHYLCNLVSNEIKLKLFPTDIQLPTTCALLIYEKEGDWINWHYDYNYYDGRFFTVLIPITNHTTCTEFQFKNSKNEIKSINLINNNSICFEGNFLYHRASKLCKNEKRVILSCQYVTNNNMNFLNKWRLKLKDFAYTGKIGN